MCIVFTTEQRTSNHVELFSTKKYAMVFHCFAKLLNSFYSQHHMQINATMISIFSTDIYCQILNCLLTKRLEA